MLIKYTLISSTINIFKQSFQMNKSFTYKKSEKHIKLISPNEIDFQIYLLMSNVWKVREKTIKSWIMESKSIFVWCNPDSIIILLRLRIKIRPQINVNLCWNNFWASIISWNRFFFVLIVKTMPRTNSSDIKSVTERE